MTAALERTTMPFFHKPSAATGRAFLAAQARLDLTYTVVGASAAVPPALVERLPPMVQVPSDGKSCG